MEAGEDMDALIHEHVMDLSMEGLVHARPGVAIQWNMKDPITLCRPYSTDIKAAWEVVEEFGCIGKDGIRWWKLEQAPTGKYYIMLRDYAQNGEISYYAEADTAPHAICLAALKAMGIEV